ncbi:hypothetical protein PanWU01x14_287320, partial [Parasponia andersonii]
ELQVAVMISVLEISINNITQRTKKVSQFKDSGSVRVGEIEYLQDAGEELRRRYEGPNGILRRYSWYNDGENSKRKRERLMSEMKTLKTNIENFDAHLDVFEKKFLKYNVPKRFQTTNKQPLKPYLERLQEFMKITWRKEAEKKREKEQRSLFEWMEKLDQSNKEDKIAFCALNSCFSELGIRISELFIEYFFLIMAVSNKSEEIMALCLYEFKAVLKCLTVEENSDSIVINTFVKMVQFFEGAMKLAGPLSDEAKDRKGKKDIGGEKVMYFLDDKMDDDLLHLIIIEVLCLEASFCSPDLPMKLINDVFFEDKLKRIDAKIDALKLDIPFFQDEDSSERKFFRQVLEDGIKELWTELEPKPGSLTKLVLL